MLALDTALDGLASFCKQNLEHGEAITQIARRADQLRDDIASIADGGGSGRVAWVIARGKGVSFGASPIAVADILRDQLFHRAQGVVLTSATLTTTGNFDYVRARLGIDFAPEERILPSPFDFGMQAALYVPERMPDPREASYLDAAEAEITKLIEITGGGAFVLCTSLRMMRALADRLMVRTDLPVLVQNSAPHPVLLERFRKHGNAVLVATNSFWQGVDVPGDALRLVVIDKLPFDVPSDPLVAARCEQLEAAGEQPFMKYLVPSAALTLKQGFGRLIRSAKDRGIVAILDTRITKKGYGRVFLNSLPPASRCYSLLEVKAFYEAGPLSALSRGMET
jgi:ATP-dependent DNA helicase DinG